MTKHVFVALGLVVTVVLLATLVVTVNCEEEWCSLQPTNKTKPLPTAPRTVTFEECAALGYPVTNSRPRKCRMPSGQLLIEKNVFVYNNPVLGATLLYPPGWKAVGRTDNLTRPARYNGEDGFFEISALPSGEHQTVEQVARALVNAEDLPYGSSPSIRAVSVDGKDARIIMASADQSEAPHKTHAVVVPLPAPVSRGAETYGYFLLRADARHIQKLMGTLDFQEPENNDKLFGTVTQTSNTPKGFTVRDFAGRAVIVRLPGKVTDKQNRPLTLESLEPGTLVSARGRIENDGFVAAHVVVMGRRPIVLSEPQEEVELGLTLRVVGKADVVADQVTYALRDADGELLAEGVAPVTGDGYGVFTIRTVYAAPPSSTGTLYVAGTASGGSLETIEVPVRFAPSVLRAHSSSSSLSPSSSSSSSAQVQP